SLFLLAAAGLFIHSLNRLKTADLGFRPENLIQISLDTRGAGYRDARFVVLYKQLMERLSAIPGVHSVSGVRNGMIQNGNTSTSVSVPGLTPPAGENLVIDSADVGPRYFATAGTSMIAGRDFSLADDERAPKVVVVNQAFARLFFSGQ